MVSFKHPKHLRIADYTYALPENRIALYPEKKRDEAKLLLYERGLITEDRYKDIARYIGGGSLMVFNHTKVVNVRLLFRKPTGAIIEVFCLEPDHKRYADITTAMQQHGEVYWRCLVGGANKWKKGTIIELHNEKTNCTLNADMVSQEEGVFLLRLYWNKPEYSFAQVLSDTGKVPLPPYLHREAEKEDDTRYQTIFAVEEGSVAAPTAGLHFTEHIFDTLREKGIEKSFITLHVGAGTFKPVKSEYIEDHEMHAEWIEIEAGFVQKLLKHLGKVTAVGTTSMRTLESLYWIGCKIRSKIDIDFADIAVSQWEPYEAATHIAAIDALQALHDWMMDNKIQRLVTRTRIMIAPGYKCRIVNHLITNFHQPGSTLLLLVAAIVGDDWRSIYEYGLNNDFRFLSYGDGCFIKT